MTVSDVLTFRCTLVKTEYSVRALAGDPSGWVGDDVAPQSEEQRCERHSAIGGGGENPFRYMDGSVDPWFREDGDCDPGDVRGVLDARVPAG